MDALAVALDLELPERFWDCLRPQAPGTDTYEFILPSLVLVQVTPMRTDEYIISAYSTFAAQLLDELVVATLTNAQAVRDVLEEYEWWDAP